MVPHVAQRGHSFKGAGLYYLHDKGADTSERVAWTHTQNVPTQDPEKALNWMAYTATHADQIKQQAGVAGTGRKSKSGAVYSFSLSWHPDQEPDKDKMLGSALETIDLLGLRDHEAVIVAHQETEHPHVHVICNLVNPQDGRTAVPSYDRLKLSEWAEKQEKESGKIYCDKRVENNRKRKEQAKPDRDYALVKHKEEKLERAQIVQDLYARSDGGKAFSAALEEAGYSLAQGDRRGFVLVDRAGEVHSLSRQLKGQRAKDIKERLADLDQSTLPIAKDLSYERRHFDRDQYTIDRQNKELDAADGAAEKKIQLEQEERKRTPREQRFQTDRSGGGGDPKKDDDPNAKKKSVNDHLIRLDKLRAWEQQVENRRDALQGKMEAFYKHKEQLEAIRDLQKRLENNNTAWGRLSGKTKDLQEELEARKLSLADTERRIAEQKGAFEAKLLQQNQENYESNSPDGPDKIQQPNLEEQRRKLREKNRLRQDRNLGHKQALKI